MKPQTGEWLRSVGVAVALAAVGPAQTGCRPTTNHAEADAPRRLEPSVVTMDLGLAVDSTEPLGRAAVEFPHGTHTEALAKEGCETCHPTGADAELSFVLKGTEGIDDAHRRMDAHHDICIGCHMERKQSSPVGAQRTGPVICAGCHVEQPAGVSARVTMRFDYSLHGRHTLAEQDKCESCHHVFDEQQQKLVYEKGKEAACSDCHGEQDDGKTLSLQHASHLDCINCHIKRADAAGGEAKSGPKHCTGCHDAEAREKVARLQVPPRIERQQPDAGWLCAEGAKAGAVPFDHKLHEPQAAFCTTCHHQTLDACSNCHTLRGDKKGGHVTLEAAFHDGQSTHSCVGCHHQRTAKADCAGCHQQMSHPPAERSCELCHSGPSNVSDPDALPPPQSLAAELAPLPLHSDDFPDTVVIDRLADTYKASKMPHGRIVAALDAKVRDNALAKAFHRDTALLCSGCHHQSPVGQRPPPCGSCHNDTADPVRDRPALVAAYHRQCIDCHQEMGIKAVGCTDCHAQASRAAAAEEVQR